MLLRYVLCLLVVLAGCLGVGLIVVGTSPLVFVDLSSIFIIIVPTIFVALMSFTLAEMKTAFKHVFSKTVDHTANYQKDIVFFSVLQTVLMISGVIGVFLGVIAMLSMAFDSAAFGRGLAQALLTTFYAIIINLVLTIPCKTTLMKKKSMQE